MFVLRNPTSIRLDLLTNEENSCRYSRVMRQAGLPRSTWLLALPYTGRAVILFTVLLLFGEEANQALSVLHKLPHLQPAFLLYRMKFCHKLPQFIPLL